MRKYTDHAMWDTVAIGRIADIHVQKHMDGNELVFDEKDRQTKQPSTQTNRQTAHNRHVVSSNRSYTSQKTETRKTRNM